MAKLTKDELKMLEEAMRLTPKPQSRNIFRLITAVIVQLGILSAFLALLVFSWRYILG